MAKQMPTTNFGMAGDMAVAVTTSLEARSFIVFNVNGVPPGAQVTFAALNLWSVPIRDNPGNITVCPATVAWAEGSITWNNQPGSTTPCKVTAGPGSTDYWWGARIDDIVQDWADGAANYGVRLTISSGQAGFSSKQAGDQSHIPQLIIVYKSF
ncbi:MAG: DNRLRE domain-containing protein [candidate division Zixibacteria bacterium]|nr:DNRLRE domain-containing protein [candidate division Zixibacteria bacterium]